ncbi:MAG: tetratricopeptide repeat protein [Spirochaetales bacterium]|nr:tetratricopeptide repeat protein [Spirochaetales bacterium]MCF7939077.1 tetratricopeptide repeat protein [Spirochaetales bacterium]
MPSIVILILVIGAAVAGLTLFLLKSFIAPKRITNMKEALKQGKSSLVIRGAKQLIAKEPRNAEAHYLLGKAYLKDKKTELALMEMKTVNQIGNFDTGIPETTFRKEIAELYLRYGQSEEALKEYIILIKKEPKVAEHYFNAGKLFEERNKAANAFKYFKKAAELNPNHAETHFRLGLILYRSKKPVEAKSELEKSLKLNPSHYKAYYYLGKLQKEGNDYTGALLSYEKAQKDPEFKPKALIERGTCYMNMQNPDKATVEFERAIRVSTDESSTDILYAHYFLGLALEKLRRMDEAIEHWEKVYSKKPAFRDVAEKLSQYQELRTDDRIKDYLTAGKEEFTDICKKLTGAMGYTLRDIGDTNGGCKVTATESESGKWRNARKMPVQIYFLRMPENVEDAIVRKMHDEMRQNSVPRGVVVNSAGFSRSAREFAETRPVDLIDKEKLQSLLKQIDW